MKIFLAHFSKFADQKISWIYFGSSYLKMKHCEGKLSGDRINLQQEIHKQAILQKEPFLKWIEAQRIANKDSIYWWMTQIAGRNNAYSNFYLNLCQLFAIKEYINKKNEKKDIHVICEDIFLLGLISQNFHSKCKFQYPILQKFYWSRDVLFLLIKGLLTKFKLIYIFLINYSYAKLTRPKVITKPTGDISLFHHCLDKMDFINNDTINCKFFTILPNWLKKKGLKVFGIPWLFNNRPSKNFYKSLRQTNCLISEDWLNIVDYIKIFKNSIKSLRTLSYKILYPEIKIKSLIFRERLYQFGEMNAIFWRYIPAIQKWSTKLNSITVYDQYQNMMYEHPIRYIIKKLPIKSTSIGYHHLLTSKEFMPHHHLDSEWNSSVKPDYVACLGKIGVNILLKQGVPQKKLLSTASLRWSIPTNVKLKTKPQKQLLVLLSLITEASVETLTKIYSNNSLIVDELKLKVKVKSHPMMNVKHILKEIKWNRLPDNWEWAKEDLNSELDDSYCTISMFTASIYDSILRGNIVVSLTSDLSLMDNYLDLFSHKYSVAHSVSEKGLTSKLKDIFVYKTKQYQDEFFKIRQELIEGINPINSKNLEAFIPKK